MNISTKYNKPSSPTYEEDGKSFNLIIFGQSKLTFISCSPYPDPTKFFGCELGAQTQFDAKNDRFIVNGSHEANKLQDMLDGFIRKFVLCPECDNPETDLVNSPGSFSFPLSTFCQILEKV